MTAFGDSTFYVALLISRDRLHAKAKSVAESFREPMVTTAYVLTEVANHLCRSATGRARFGQLLAGIQADANTTIIESSHDLWEQGLDLYFSRSDKEWSLTDCISFVVMKERGLTEAITADHHFQQAGFAALLLQR
jgi:predicted nucleic acid-binding protein